MIEALLLAAFHLKLSQTIIERPTYASQQTSALRLAKAFTVVIKRVVVGQSSSLHSWLQREDSPEQVPPFDSGLVFTRVSVLLPPPHVFEHSPSVHAPHAQLTGGGGGGGARRRRGGSRRRRGGGGGGTGALPANAAWIVMASNSSRATSFSSSSSSLKSKLSSFDTLPSFATGCFAFMPVAATSPS